MASVPESFVGEFKLAGNAPTLPIRRVGPVLQSTKAAQGQKINSHQFYTHAHNFHTWETIMERVLACSVNTVESVFASESDVWMQVKQL